MHTAIKATSLLILLASGIPVAASAKPDRDLQTCRTIADRDARLACYDRLADEAEKQFGGTRAQRDPQRDFGASPSMLPDDVRAAEITTISAKITQVQYERLSGWTFAIDTNAVWTQTEKSNLRRDPKVGDTVELSKGLLGSYNAKINDGRPFRVKRVR